MRLDHIAYRVRDRYKTYSFFHKAFGYNLGTSFEIKFGDGTHADCLALLPPGDRPIDTGEWDVLLADRPTEPLDEEAEFHSYHAPPEIFVSDGGVGSIVGDWVAERGGVGGIHHIAYQVDDVAGTMKKWKEEGYAEFYSDEPISCENPRLIQVFTKPSELTGVIYELIAREGDGFCQNSVRELMESTDNKEQHVDR
jgi:catechol 2,3-dioxygenase-like lactoylglutathione lyase family enzyme